MCPIDSINAKMSCLGTRIKNMRKTTILFTLGLISMASFSSASILNIYGMAGNKSQIVNLNYNGKNLQVYSGPQSASFDHKNIFESYCVDMDHDNNLPVNYSVYSTDAKKLANYSLVNSLFGHFSNKVTNSQQGSALQLAIWDAVVDGGDGLDKGNLKAFKLSDGVKNQFNFYREFSLKNSYAETSFAFYSANHKGKLYQDMIAPINSIPPVPEPASLAVIGIGCLALFKLKINAS